MAKIKELKKTRNALSEKIRGIRLELKECLGALNTADTKNLNRLSDKFQYLNAELNGLLSSRDEVSDEIASRNKPTKKHLGKVRKVHNVAGKSIDPKGFTGIVSGGAPGSGKRS